MPRCRIFSQIIPDVPGQAGVHNMSTFGKPLMFGGFWFLLLNLVHWFKSYALKIGTIRSIIRKLVRNKITSLIHKKWPIPKLVHIYKLANRQLAQNEYNLFKLYSQLLK